MFKLLSWNASARILMRRRREIKAAAAHHDSVGPVRPIARRRAFHHVHHIARSKRGAIIGSRPKPV